MMGEMAASFAHEINNPLEIIDAFAYTLKEAIAAGDAAYLDEALAGDPRRDRTRGKIVHGLRKFARERDDAPTDVAIATIVGDAMDLWPRADPDLRGRARGQGRDCLVRARPRGRARAGAGQLAEQRVRRRARRTGQVDPAGRGRSR